MNGQIMIQVQSIIEADMKDTNNLEELMKLVPYFEPEYYPWLIDILIRSQQPETVAIGHILTMFDGVILPSFEHHDDTGSHQYIGLKTTPVTMELYRILEQSLTGSLQSRPSGGLFKSQVIHYAMMIAVLFLQAYKGSDES